MSRVCFLVRAMGYCGSSWTRRRLAAWQFSRATHIAVAADLSVSGLASDGRMKVMNELSQGRTARVIWGLTVGDSGAKAERGRRGVFARTCEATSVVG